MRYVIHWVNWLGVKQDFRQAFRGQQGFGGRWAFKYQQDFRWAFRDHQDFRGKWVGLIQVGFYQFTRGQFESHLTIDIGKAIHKLEFKGIRVPSIHVFVFQSKPKHLPKDGIG